MPTVLISGANRGIGLEFVRQYAAEGWRVLACCRAPDAASDLRGVAGGVELHALDVSDPDAARRLAGLLDSPIDVLIANAGVGAREVGEFGAIDYAAFACVLAVNTLGAIALCEAFAPQLIKARGKMATISSTLGSIADSTGGHLAYRTSKAALNMATTAIAAALAPKGVAVAPFHPGWVQTDMGGASAPVTAAESVAGLRRRIGEMTPSAKPPFLDYSGRALAW